MVQQIIEHLKSVLNETGFFQKIYPLCVLVKTGNSTKPVRYIGGGKMEDIVYFSNNEGLGYFRKTADVKISEAPFIKTTSCKTGPNNYKYQLKFIGCVPKSKAECDNEYADDYICNTIVSSISGLSGLAKEIGAISVKANIEGFKTDAPVVYQSEFAGQTIEFPFQYSLFSVNFIVNIVAAPECFQKLCYGQVA